jgi:hypothetical protein
MKTRTTLRRQTPRRWSAKGATSPSMDQYMARARLQFNPGVVVLY